MVNWRSSRNNSRLDEANFPSAAPISVSSTCICMKQSFRLPSSCPWMLEETINSVISLHIRMHFSSFWPSLFHGLLTYSTYILLH